MWAQHISNVCQCLTGGCGAAVQAHSEDIKKVGMVQKGAVMILETCCEIRDDCHHSESRRVPPERADNPGSHKKPVECKAHKSPPESGIRIQPMTHTFQSGFLSENPA